MGIGYAPPTYAKSGADALYINGNVGIGTESPGGGLHISKNYNQGTWLKIENQNLSGSWGYAATYDATRYIDISGGAEYWYGRPEEFMFAVRAGYFYEDPDFGARNFMTFGAGIKYDLYGFDFSYISTVGSNSENHPLDGTLRFSLVIGWDTVPQTKPGLPRGI